MERTGHRSLDGVRHYKRTSDEQHEAYIKLQATMSGPSNYIYIWWSWNLGMSFTFKCIYASKHCSWRILHQLMFICNNKHPSKQVKQCATSVCIYSEMIIIYDYELNIPLEKGFYMQNPCPEGWILYVESTTDDDYGIQDPCINQSYLSILDSCTLSTCIYMHVCTCTMHQSSPPSLREFSTRSTQTARRSGRERGSRCNRE